MRRAGEAIPRPRPRRHRAPAPRRTTRRTGRAASAIGAAFASRTGPDSCPHETRTINSFIRLCQDVECGIAHTFTNGGRNSEVPWLGPEHEVVIVIVVLAIHHVPGRVFSRQWPSSCQKVSAVSTVCQFAMITVNPGWPGPGRYDAPQGVTAAVGKAAVWYTVTRLGDPGRKAPRRSISAPPSLIDFAKSSLRHQVPSVPRLCALPLFFSKMSQAAGPASCCSTVAPRLTEMPTRLYMAFALRRYRGITSARKPSGNRTKSTFTSISLSFPDGDLGSSAKSNRSRAPRVLYPTTQSGTSGRPVSSLPSRWKARTAAFVSPP